MKPKQQQTLSQYCSQFILSISVNYLLQILSLILRGECWNLFWRFSLKFGYWLSINTFKKKFGLGPAASSSSQPGFRWMHTRFTRHIKLQILGLLDCWIDGLLEPLSKHAWICRKLNLFSKLCKFIKCWNQFFLISSTK